MGKKSPKNAPLLYVNIVFTAHTGTCLANGYGSWLEVTICLHSWLSHYVPLLVAYFFGLLNSISVLYMTPITHQNLAGPKDGHRNSWENPVDEEIYVIEC